MSTAEHATTSRQGDAEEPAYRYTAALAGQIEHRWQDYWEKHGTFHAPNPTGNLASEEAVGEKYYLLDMFPYPSGKGLHVGHPLGYIATDVIGRYQRMKGKNVLHALAYDAFGLPAEQYAVQTGQHPRTTTEENISNMRRQLRRLGLGHDSRRSFATTDPDYMRWTQWIFLQLYNSFYDPQAPRHDGATGSARPISELAAEMASGQRPTPGGRPWTMLSEAERAAALDAHRLAYISEEPVNWCPGLGTVLANEEVTAEGLSERGNFPVFKRNLRQWMMRITAYADRLIDDLDVIDWPEPIKLMQRNWIGRSQGSMVRFLLSSRMSSGEVSNTHADPSGEAEVALEVFTTRPDTLFGATFMVLAPEHSLLDDAVPAAWPAGTKDAWRQGYDDPTTAVRAYREQASAKTEAERQADGTRKTGVFTGIYATNPATGAQLPVFSADYVLLGYGTGAIMAVPAEDERDHAFAEAYELDIVRTVQPPPDFTGGAWMGEGEAINSANAEISLNGMAISEAIEAMTTWLRDKNLGEPTTTYRLRDWLFSRQRYWGEPFPIVYDAEGRAHDLPEHMLPVELPEVPDYSPRTYSPDDATSTPEPPLGRVPEWVEVRLDLGDGQQTYYRDTNTMPNWAGSCWYELRYLDPDNDEALVDPINERYWMGPHQGTTGPTGGADLYVGGVEHAVLHLLYARFWHKVLYDLGHIASYEPFYKLFNQGYIQAYAYTDATGQYVPAEDVVETHGDGGQVTYTWGERPVRREYGKMGKSLRNIVTPDEIYDSYGADTFRVYEMSMGPLADSRPWETRAVVGSQRFLQRLWRNVVDESTGELVITEEPASEPTRKMVAKTIAEVDAELAGMRVNTAIARLIVLNNHLTSLDPAPREAVEPLVLMTAPVAPHIAEELWHRLNHEESLAHEPFPVADPALLVAESVTCIVQVAGKLRDRLEVSPEADEATLERLALDSESVQRALDGRDVRKVVVKAPKLVNIVPA